MQNVNTLGYFQRGIKAIRDMQYFKSPELKYFADWDSKFVISGEG